MLQIGSNGVAVSSASGASETWLNSGAFPTNQNIIFTLCHPFCRRADVHELICETNNNIAEKSLFQGGNIAGQLKID